MRVARWAKSTTIKGHISAEYSLIRGAKLITTRNCVIATLIKTYIYARLVAASTAALISNVEPAV